jgi:hypothetical protein
MKILVFTEGTLFIHQEWLGLSSQQMTEKVKAGEIPGYESLVPIGNAPDKLRAWENQGLQIVYLTSRRDPAEVAQVRDALHRFGFPPGELQYRLPGENYQDAAVRILPDVIVEDDCASIGGGAEMVYPRLPEEIKAHIRLVMVPEFCGVEDLPDDLSLIHSR